MSQIAFLLVAYSGVIFVTSLALALHDLLDARADKQSYVDVVAVGKMIDESREIESPELLLTQLRQFTRMVRPLELEPFRPDQDRPILKELQKLPFPARTLSRDANSKAVVAKTLMELVAVAQEEMRPRQDSQSV